MIQMAVIQHNVIGALLFLRARHLRRNDLFDLFFILPIALRSPLNLQLFGSVNQQTALRQLMLALDPDPIDRHRRQQQPIGRQDAQRPPPVKGRKRDPARRPLLSQQKRGDQKAAEHEEQIDAEEGAIEHRGMCMREQHQHNGYASQSIERWVVAQLERRLHQNRTPFLSPRHRPGASAGGAGVGDDGGHDRALLAGLATGLVTGLLHTFMGIPAILAGILTQLALYSINLKIMGKANQSINVDKYDLLISLRWVKELALHNPIIMVILVSAVVIGVLYWFFGTELGCGIRATGSNPAMSRAQGINTGFNKVLALMISNGLVGLCGGIYAQYQGAADVNMGRGAIVIGLAAVIISEVIFGKFCAHRKAAFAFTLGAVFIGAILYYLVIALVLWLKMPSDYMKLFSAVVVACFLAVPYMKDTYFKKGRAK